MPARDEEGRIGACLDALLASRGATLEVLVLDDGSADATAAVVADRASRDPRVRLLPGAPVPGGWLGKPHACAQLAAAARGTILAFVDADVRVAPHGVAAAPRCCAAPASTWCRPTRASSPTGQGRGWCSRCCSGCG